MKAIVDIPAGDKHCGECPLPKFEENPNGWAWVCTLFSMRLTDRYWRNERGWKHQRMRDPKTLERCSECLKGTNAYQQLSNAIDELAGKASKLPTSSIGEVGDAETESVAEGVPGPAKTLVGDGG